jgi:hypothetical protein
VTHPLLNFLGGSQCVLIRFPNQSPSSQLMCSSRCSLDSSTTLLSHMLCPKLISFHLYSWVKGMALLSSNGNHFGSLQHFKFQIIIIKTTCDGPIKMSCCNKKKVELGRHLSLSIKLMCPYHLNIGLSFHYSENIYKYVTISTLMNPPTFLDLIGR